MNNLFDNRQGNNPRQGNYYDNDFFNSGYSFLESNNLIARISFLLIVIFLFIFFLNISMAILTWVFTRNTSPHLLDGTINAKQTIIIPQDPSSNSSVMVPRSINGKNGIEFSWSVWIFIDDLQYLSGQYRHIFSKGNNNLQSNGLVYPNNAPGLYIDPYSNDLVVIMNTFDVIDQKVKIENIPLNKWVNVIIRCKNTTLDVYINGLITRSLNMEGVPKQNYGDVNVALNGGFSGFISDLWYYGYALGINEIQNINTNGPNLKMIGPVSLDKNKTNFFSLRWYFSGNKDQFNP